MQLRDLPAVVALFALAVAALAQPAKPIKVALIEDKDGPLDAYAKRMVTGFHPLARMRGPRQRGSPLARG